MTLLEAAEEALRQAGAPLHYTKIISYILDKGLWSTTGETPERSLLSSLSREIQNHGDQSTFISIPPGTYTLRNLVTQQHKDQAYTAATSDHQQLTENTNLSTAAPLSFTDATEQVLRRAGKAMGYREITQEAIDLGLISTRGRTPEATLYVAIMNEIERQTRRGEKPRFVRYSGGIIGLAALVATASEQQINTRADEVRSQMRQALSDMPWRKFEHLIELLLGRMGFVEVEIGKGSNDGGIDVKGTMVVAGVMPIRVGVQVKRQKDNVQREIVQKLRGSIGPHWQGMIVTNSDFSRGAQDDARDPELEPVALINGDQLIGLLLDYKLGVKSTEPGSFEFIGFNDTLDTI